MALSPRWWRLLLPEGPGSPGEGRVAGEGTRHRTQRRSRSLKGGQM